MRARSATAPPRLSAAALLIALGTLGAATPARAGTEVCGTLRQTQEWTAAGSPYLVTADLYIPNTSRLRIGPGVTVRFARPGRPCDAEDPSPPPVDWSDSAYVGIRIEGDFHALGTEEAPIVFEPEQAAPGEIAWDGLRITGLKPNETEVGFAVFRGANRALVARKSSFRVHHALFEGNNTGMDLGLRGDLTVVNCAFIGNLSAGLAFDLARPRLAGNIFADNRGYGLRADARTGPLIVHNAFWNNGEEHCSRCPPPILPGGKDGRDTLPDPRGNLAVDPIFVGSESHKAAQRADLSGDTPPHLIKDPALAKLEAEASAKWAKKEKDFEPQGKGPFRLSVYSRLIDAGPPESGFKDRDGSRNDIGLHGGPMGKLARDPF